MDLTPTDSQRMLRESVARYVAENYDSEGRRKAAQEPQGFSAQHWRNFAELGWLGLAFSEEDGGFGGGPVDIGIVMEEFGRGAVAEPFLSTVLLGGGAIAACGSAAQKRDLLPQIVQGDLHLSFAHYEKDPRHGLNAIASEARREQDGWHLRGRKVAVPDAAAAGIHIVSARIAGSGDDAVALFLVPRNAKGLTLRDAPRMGGGRIADLVLDDVVLPYDARLGASENTLPAIERIIDGALTAMSAEAVGLMSALVDATIEFTKTRKQFGRALAANQVIRHRLVDMYIACDEARSTALRAALYSGESSSDVVRAMAASGAKCKVGTSARKIAEEAVQLHGAMGVTDELDVGLYFKRLLAFETMLGSGDHHLRRHATLMRQSESV